MSALLAVVFAINGLVEWEFPRLGSCHEGLPFSDGNTGVLVWGGGDTINLTLGRGDLWDHRGGYTWSQEQSYTNIVRLARSADVAALTKLFHKDVPAGEPRNPYILPLGRIVVTVADCEVVRGELDPKTGLAALTFVSKAGKRFNVPLAMSKRAFAMKFPAGIDFSAKIVSSMDDPTFGKQLRAIRITEPEKWSAADGSQGGLFWRLPNHKDAPVSVAWTKRDGELSVSVARGEDRVKAEAGYEEVRNESVERWSAFWQRGAKVKIPDETIQQIFDYGMYRFGAMTDPEGYPAGLQGQWLEDNGFIPWNGDYHFNINVQECYSPAYRGGHFEHLKPLWRMMMSWKPLLRENARKFVGIDDGYVLPHSVSDQGVNIGGFWTGTIDHASAAWMASMMFRYVKYSGDVEFLRRDAYDFMKGTMNVYLAMVEEYQGRLSIPIAPSPEWQGDSVTRAVGRDPSFQLAAAHRLAIDLIDAAKLLGEKPDARWLDLRKRLPLYTVYRRGRGELPPVWGSSKDGYIAIFEGTGLWESHRHHSHMAGIYPFCTIPHAGSHAQAIARTFDNWIEKGTGLWTGWCVSWASILHTDAGNAVAAVQMLHDWKTYFNNPGHGSLHDAWNRGFTQMCSRRDIMQMDGQCAAVTAVMELMVHEIDGEVKFFRGCPSSWKDVSFENVALADGRRVSGRRVNGTVSVEFSEK